MPKIYANGTATFTIPVNEKVAAFSYSPMQIYQRVGYPNQPDSWDLLIATGAGDSYTSAAFASGATIRIDASASDAFYEVGAAPVIGDPTADISAADATFTITGLAAAQGGSVTAVGGTSSTAANAGGAVVVRGGQPGATGVGGSATLIGGAGGATSGAGGQALVTGGAGTAGNGNGGSVLITAGAAHGTGAAGIIIERSARMVKQGAQTAKTVSSTLTAAQVMTGIITVAQGAGATSAQQLPLATAMDTALPDSAADDAFDFSVINISTVDAEDASVTTNTGWTLVGSMDIHAYSAAGSLNSSARFRARKTGAGAWTLYRIS